jgi:ComEC/Rec2-related protein
MLREIEARPFFLLLIGLLFGLSFPTISWIFGVGFVLFLFLKLRPFALVSAAWFIAGFLSFPLPQASNSVSSGVIQSFAEYYRGETQATLRSSGVDYLLKVPGEIALAPGDEITISESRILSTKDNRFSGVIRTSRVEVFKNGWLHWLSKQRILFLNHLRSLYGERDAAWVSALTFNFTEGLEKDEKENLRSSGTFHLVSASGMHVWVIAISIHYLLVQLRILRHYQLPIVFIALLAYCGLTGFHPPTLRAALMWLFRASAYLFKRTPDGLSALSISALLWLLFEPQDVFLPSFQLSYLVTGMLVIWFERRRQEGYNELRSSLESSLIASVAAEPLAAWWFGRIVFIGPISNLLVGFASSMILIFGVLSLIPWIGNAFASVNRPLIWWVQTVTEITAKVPFVTLSPKQLPAWTFAIYFGLLAIWVLGRRADGKDPFKN